MKYFGFDDMSDSEAVGGDDNDDDRRMKMRARFKAVAEETPPVALEDSHDEPVRNCRALEGRAAERSQNYSRRQDGSLRAGQTMSRAANHFRKKKDKHKVDRFQPRSRPFL